MILEFGEKTVSTPDIDKSRAWNGMYVDKQYIADFLTDVLNNAGYSKLRIANETDNQTIQYQDNEQFWQDIFKHRLYEGKLVSLNEFHITEWIPLSPGKYFLPESTLIRNQGRYFFSYDSGEYLPRGKEMMILSGIGSIRLRLKNHGFEKVLLFRSHFYRYYTSRNSCTYRG